MEEGYKHPKMAYSTGLPMELDIFTEDLKLAIEYQGQQHYVPQYWAGTDFETQKRRDEEKKHACKQVNIPVLLIDEAQYHFDRSAILAEQNDFEPGSNDSHNSIRSNSKPS